MGAFDRLFARLGYVRLRDFGLIVTADRRVVSTRPAVLDDGFGARIVGWEDNDLAVLELAKHGEPAAPAKPPPAPRRAAAMPVAAPAFPPAKQAQVIPIAVPAVAEPVALAVAKPKLEIVAPARVVAAPAPAASSVRAAEPAPPEPDEGDDWEWEIAAARARAADDFTPEAPTATWNEETATRTHQAWVAPPAAAGDSRRTVIPVPTLPPAADVRLVRPLDRDEATRSILPTPRRFPRATNQRLAQEETSQTVVSSPSRAARR